MDSSNQNINYGPQQGASGLQTQTAVVPQTNVNTPIANGGNPLFGNNSDTASLLNQSQVLGTTTEPASVNTVPAATDSASHVPVTGIVIALILLIALAAFFRREEVRALFAQEPEVYEEESENEED